MWWVMIVGVGVTTLIDDGSRLCIKLRLAIRTTLVLNPCYVSADRAQVINEVDDATKLSHESHADGDLQCLSGQG